MTVATETRKVSYTGDELVNDYPVPFPFQGSDQLVVKWSYAEVVEQTLVEGVDYDVSGGDGEIGTVTFLWNPDTGSTILIERVVDYLQPMDLNEQGGYSAKTHEDAADFRVYQIQQLSDRIGALEALVTVPTTVAFTDLVIVEAQFSTQANAEDTYPQDFAVLNAARVVRGVVKVKATDVADPTRLNEVGVVVENWSQTGATLRLGFVTGLESLREYNLQLLVIYEPA